MLSCGTTKGNCRCSRKGVNGLRRSWATHHLAAFHRMVLMISTHSEPAAAEPSNSFSEQSVAPSRTTVDWQEIYEFFQ